MSVVVLGGGGVCQDVRAFDLVKDSLVFDKDVYLAAMLARPLGVAIPKGSIVYNMEPLYVGCRSFSIGYLETLSKYPVVDYEQKNVDYLRSIGIEAYCLPYRWHPSLERAEQKEDKPFDVLVVGSVNPRRQAIVNALRAKYSVVWATGAYGKQLDELVTSSKVVLNIHYCDEHPLEVARINYLLANNCTVVSERSWDSRVDVEYEPLLYFVSSVNKLACAIDYALHNPLHSREKFRALEMDCSEANEWANKF